MGFENRLNCSSFTGWSSTIVAQTSDLRLTET